MGLRKIDKSFLHTALSETRRIKLEIKCLEEELERMDNADSDDFEFELPGQDLLFNLPGSRLFSAGNLFKDKDYLDTVVEQHASYYEYLKKNTWSGNFIPGKYIAVYHDLLLQFEEKVHQIYPNYRVLP